MNANPVALNHLIFRWPSRQGSIRALCSCLRLVHSVICCTTKCASVQLTRSRHSSRKQRWPPSQHQQKCSCHPFSSQRTPHSSAVHDINITSDNSTTTANTERATTAVATRGEGQQQRRQQHQKDYKHKSQVSEKKQIQGKLLPTITMPNIGRHIVHASTFQSRTGTPLFVDFATSATSCVLTVCASNVEADLDTEETCRWARWAELGKEEWKCYEMLGQQGGGWEFG